MSLVPDYDSDASSGQQSQAPPVAARKSITLPKPSLVSSIIGERWNDKESHLLRGASSDEEEEQLKPQPKRKQEVIQSNSLFPTPQNVTKAASHPDAHSSSLHPHPPTTLKKSMFSLIPADEPDEQLPPYPYSYPSLPTTAVAMHPPSLAAPPPATVDDLDSFLPEEERRKRRRYCYDSLSNASSDANNVIDIRVDVPMVLPDPADYDTQQRANAAKAAASRIAGQYWDRSTGQFRTSTGGSASGVQKKKSQITYIATDCLSKQADLEGRGRAMAAARRSAAVSALSPLLPSMWRLCCCLHLYLFFQ